VCIYFVNLTKKARLIVKNSWSENLWIKKKN
jgi:hypothetical protein